MNKLYKRLKRKINKLYKLVLLGTIIMIPFEGFTLVGMAIIAKLGIDLTFYAIDNCINTYKKIPKKEKLVIEEYQPISYKECNKEIKKSEQPTTTKKRALILTEKIKKLEEKIRVTNNKRILNELKIELTKLQFALQDLLSENEETINRQLALHENLFKDLDNEIRYEELSQLNKNFENIIEIIKTKGTIH